MTTALVPRRSAPPPKSGPLPGRPSPGGELRVIDAHTGGDIRPGDRVWLPSSWRGNKGVRRFYDVLAIEDAILFAALHVRTDRGRKGRVRLIVRFLHPQYLFQRIAFLPS